MTPICCCSRSLYVLDEVADSPGAGRFFRVHHTAKRIIIIKRKRMQLVTAARLLWVVLAVGGRGAVAIVQVCEEARRLV